MGTATRKKNGSEPDGTAEQGGAGLRYVNDDGPGITRVRAGKEFHYFDARGKRIDDERTIARINALAIPPAYEDVWICPLANGHIQATGRDARGRKQYRYHPHWREVRDEDKYQQLHAFGLALPRIRRRVAKDMLISGLCQDKVLATVVRLLETTLIRVGTREYARANKSYGLTTLKRRHASVRADHIRFQFTGKSGVRHDVTVTDARIARIVKRCMDIPGHQLFHYQDESGAIHPVDSAAVNEYLKEASNADFTAKHYRTWAGSVYAFVALQKLQSASQPPGRQTVAEVVKLVARRLGNTPAVCRACYIHPAVLDAYLAGTLPPRQAAPRGSRELNADERRLLAFLEIHTQDAGVSGQAPAVRNEKSRAGTRRTEQRRAGPANC